MLIRLSVMSCVLALAACSSDSSSDAASDEAASKGTVSVIGSVTEPTYSLCETTFTKTEFLKMMNGNLVFVANANSHGKSASEAIGELVTMLVVNGLNFETLAEYEFDFEDGDYTFKAGDDGYTFSLYFASDWQTFSAGDKIPYNVFDYTSYLSNINVRVLPTPAITYGHGPLYDLIDGSIDTSGASLASLKVDFKIHTELIAFALKSQSTIAGQAPREADTLLWSMTTTQAALPTIAAQFAAGGYGLDFGGTVYDSKYYDLVQTYGTSPALIKKDDTGYFWELTYQSVVEKSGVELFQTGIASERVANTTSYFCDAEHAARIGVATHASDFESGSFVFEDGTTIAYGLEDF